jgi:hypothetical protein
MNRWFCEEHYNIACKTAGCELEVCTVPNWCKQSCAECDEIAIHLTVIPAEVINRVSAEWLCRVRDAVSNAGWHP